MYVYIFTHVVIIIVFDELYIHFKRKGDGGKEGRGRSLTLGRTNKRSGNAIWEKVKKDRKVRKG
jgi:hypothetical protein